MKEIFNNFIKNKWHLHSLTLPFNILFLWLIVNYDFLSLNDTGTFFHIFICIFLSTIAAFLVEWIQGAFFGANKTESEIKASNLDILTSIIAGTVGSLFGVIFPPATTLAWTSLIIILVLELYRRFNKIKKSFKK